MTGSGLRQFFLCARSLRRLPSDWDRSAEFSAFCERYEHELAEWLSAFAADLGNASAYCGKPKHVPELEDRVHEVFSRAGMDADFPRIEYRPALCLTHDVDYLRQTAQEVAKSMVARRRLPKLHGRKAYMESLRHLLEAEAACGARAAATIFVAGTTAYLRGWRGPVSWLLDPAYRLDGEEASWLLELFKEYGCEIGLHGSYHSSSDARSIANQLEALRAFHGAPVLSARQHWLRLADGAFGNLRACGIRTDSTLGWNNAAGFRCGMSRPFALALAGGGELAEVPMAVMDGAIFDSMKLDEDSALSLLCAILSEVQRRGGCVALDWHERSAVLGWSRVYEASLKWAASRGFRFLTVSEAATEYAGL
ncbi:MAG: hypothetical protein A3J74_05735 [Elusimicrobia bacterium RIFCSPHIGHO2_02_FULL_57_9]|nr:MAG: hypothetical protein A3J74_05735 [Elusimicrobia bacterium RIFCSPHIGHO2_02_FULL_57_9]